MKSASMSIESLPWPSLALRRAWMLGKCTTKMATQATTASPIVEYVSSSQNIRHSYASGTRRCGGPMRSQPVMYRALGTKECAVCLYHSCCAGAGRFALCSVTGVQASDAVQAMEVCVADLPQPKLPGEGWKPMLCPVSGQRFQAGW